MPVPVPESDAPVDQGWSYSFVADQAAAPPAEAEAPDLPLPAASFGEPLSTQTAVGVVTIAPISAASARRPSARSRAICLRASRLGLGT